MRQEIVDRKTEVRNQNWITSPDSIMYIPSSKNPKGFLIRERIFDIDSKHISFKVCHHLLL